MAEKTEVKHINDPSSGEPKQDIQGDEVDAAEEVAVVNAQQEDAIQLTREMFTKLTEYIRGDLAATAEDYKLLEQMNRLTTKKYSDMKQIATELEKGMKDLNTKYSNLQPYLDQIDQIEESVANLEQAALRLDAYSKRLEAKFKQLDKR